MLNVTIDLRVIPAYLCIHSGYENISVVVSSTEIRRKEISIEKILFGYLFQNIYVNLWFVFKDSLRSSGGVKPHTKLKRAESHQL